MNQINKLSLTEETAKRNAFAKFLILLKRSRTAMFGFLILVILVLTAIFQEQIAPFDPIAQDIRNRLSPPAWAEGGDPKHILGTDQLGRDILSRIIYGVRISLFVSILGVIVSMVIGTIMGLFSGFYGGTLDTILMRFVDIFLAFPFLLLAIVFVVTLGPSLRNIVIILGLTGWVPYTRLVRAQTLSIREQEYVQVARLIGDSNIRIIFRHILPNLVAPIIIYSTLEVGLYIISEASLTFLGMGIPPVIPTWGNMLASGRDYLSSAWWLSSFPGFAIVLTVLAFNFLGDWLRDALDPRTTYDV